MNDSKIPVRYSKALFQLATEKNLLDNIYQDIVYIAGICEVAEIKEILFNPIMIPSKKKAIFHELLGENISNITLSMVDLMIKNGREQFLPSITRVFRQETLKFKGITETGLTTAVPVNKLIKKQITDFVSSAFNTKINLIENVDKEILGGFILRINDSFIDASLRKKLRMIKKGLSVQTKNV